MRGERSSGPSMWWRTRGAGVLGPVLFVSMRRNIVAVVGTYTWELDAAVTAFWCCAALLEVEEPQRTAGGLDDADLVGAGVVAVAEIMLARLFLGYFNPSSL
jgi:hypothetical protein